MIVESIVLGVLVSAAVQWLKKKYKTSKKGTLAMVAVISIVLAFAGWILQQFNMLATFSVILASASTVYAFILQHLEKEEE